MYDSSPTLPLAPPSGAPAGGPAMGEGAVVAERFVIELRAGFGGMGDVFRAVDRQTGERVALKLLRESTEEHVARFEREARLLAALRHPAVVRYVAHGETDDGRHYLAMEWLEGEDLATRLRRGPLGVAESLAVAGRIAAALVAVHGQGVVHRDLKPANVFLPGGDPGRATLIDFGIARPQDTMRRLTSNEVILGTPAYMAPEQIQGARSVDVRADVYSLGVILFECLTGHPPFLGPHMMAVLAKVLFEDVPRPSELVAGLPPDLDALVAHWTAKDPELRPANAPAVLAALRARSAWTAPAWDEERSLTGSERRLVCVILAVDPRLGQRLLPVDVADDTFEALAPSVLVALGEAARRHGARLEVLRDGSVAALIARPPSPTDLARAGARCALAIRALLPGARVTLAIGWDAMEGTQPLGRVIDRAGSLLEARGEATRPSAWVLLDAMTAALLDPRFDLARGEDGPRLLGEREPADEVRPLLGKPTPFLGRDREVRMLERLFEECILEPRAHAALVTGSAGAGKSRLRIELLRRFVARHERLTLWVAYGDPARVSAPLGLLGQVVRHATRISDGEPLEERRHKLAMRVALHVEPRIRERVTVFLGEIIGTPFGDEQSVELRAARQDPVLMGDQMRRAWLDFLEAECRARPVLLVLEDLHWGDAATAAYVDVALRLLRDLPLMVLAFARPEVSSSLPGLWSEREATEVRLYELPRRACEGLVRAALGDLVPAAHVEDLVERSAGNAFFLEELVRAVAEGRGEGAAPDTVVGMVQSRFEALEPEARRLLRAASVFGEAFWSGAVARLVGVAADSPLFAERLAALEQREWIVRRPSPRFRGETAYVFHHGLLREAAYGMLTDEDRALGHRLAGEWLEGVGENDAVVLAQHFDRGGEAARAVRWYRAAAEQALKANDLGAAFERAARGVACGASGAVLGQLDLIRAEAERWRGHYAQAVVFAQRALVELPLGAERWYVAVRELLASAVSPDQRQEALAAVRVLEEACPGAPGSGPAMIAMAWAVTRLLFMGQSEQSERLCERIEEAAGRFGDDPAVSASIFEARAFREIMRSGDYARFCELWGQALIEHERAGDERASCLGSVNLAGAYLEMGAYGMAKELCAGTLSDAERMGLGVPAMGARLNLGIALFRLGACEEAIDALRGALAGFETQGDVRLEGLAQGYLAYVLCRVGALEEAEAAARRSAERTVANPTVHPFALAMLASVLLARGRAPEALATVQDVAALLAASSGVEEEGFLRLAVAEVLDAVGDRAGAREAIAAARARLVARSEQIRDAAWRRRFVEEVPENARTMELARAWIGDEGLVPGG